MKYELHSSPEGATIDVVASGEEREVLVEALTGCSQGRCFCDIGEQCKLDGIDIEQAGDHIEIVMHARPGEEFDCSKIGICLDVAARKAEQKGRKK